MHFTIQDSFGMALIHAYNEDLAAIETILKNNKDYKIEEISYNFVTELSFKDENYERKIGVMYVSFTNEASNMQKLNDFLKSKFS